jgi:hypothetical protein
VDPISLVIRKSGVVTICNDVAPPRYLIGGKWFCAYPSLRDCSDPEDIPLDPVRINDVPLLGQGLGQSIYSRVQMESFAQFADSQGTRRAFLAETAQIAFGNRRDGQWGLGLTDVAMDHIVDTVGSSLIPLYRFVGPFAVTIMLGMFVLGIVKTIIDVIIRTVMIYKVRGPGWWLATAMWAVPFQVAMTPLRWITNTADDVTERVNIEMERTAITEELRRVRRQEEMDTEAPILLQENDSETHVYPSLRHSPLGWRRQLAASSGHARPYLWNQPLQDPPSAPSGHNRD